MLSTEELKTFIESNTIPTKNGRKCVDGRYLSNTDDLGMIARPGGDLGYVMALLSINAKKQLGLTPQKCFDTVFSALLSLNEKFYMHTDHHADPSASSPQQDSRQAGQVSPSDINHQSSVISIGCGHAAKPMNEELATGYGLSHLEEQQLVKYAKEMAEKSPDRIKLVNLPGNHKEEGVLVVTSANKTVNSQDDHHMFFIYDKTRDVEFVRKLVSALNMPEITPEEFQETLDMQTNATLKLLAKGLSIFEVNVDSELSVKQVGIVE